MNKEDALCKARYYHDSAVTKQIEDDLHVMVRALIGNYTLRIDHCKDGFDPYPSCKHNEKTYCYSRPKKYMGYIEGKGYAFYGDSKIEVYCNIISAIAGNKLYLPYSVLPESVKK